VFRQGQRAGGCHFLRNEPYMLLKLLDSHAGEPEMAHCAGTWDDRTPASACESRAAGCFPRDEPRTPWVPPGRPAHFHRTNPARHASPKPMHFFSAYNRANPRNRSESMAVRFGTQRSRAPACESRASPCPAMAREGYTSGARGEPPEFALTAHMRTMPVTPNAMMRARAPWTDPRWQ
jgi:hypothetical protein